MLNSSSSSNSNNSNSNNSGFYVASSSYYQSGFGGSIKYYEADKAKKEILDAIKEEMKKDDDINDLLEIAKAVLLDYITKIVDKPELVISDELKKKETEINNLKQEIEILRSRITALECSNIYLSGGTPSPYNYYTTSKTTGISDYVSSTGSQTI